MNFFYSPAIAASPETGAPQLVLRPMVPIRVVGPRRSGQYAALVDTGADNTIFPKRLADDLGIALERGKGPDLTAFGGQKLPIFFGDVQMEVSEGEEKSSWRSRVQFFEFDDTQEETLVLGHTGFLDYFSATFDGLLGMLSLAVNEELPASG